MEIMEGIEIVNFSLFIKKTKTLIISDLHIGLEAALNKEGVLIPRFQFDDLKEKTKQLLTEKKPERVILNGDIKHNFGKISKQEWKNTFEYIDMLKENCEIVLIKGNHDKMLDPITDKRDLEIKTHHYEEGIYISHGDEIPANIDFHKAKVLIVGHEHPSITLRDGNRTETYKCFLKGNYKDKSLIVMPSAHTLSEGTDITKEKLLSPFLNENTTKNFEVYITDEEIYYFGTVKEIIENF